MGPMRLTASVEDVSNELAPTPQGAVMYLGTNDPALQAAKTIRDQEIQLASNYHKSRVARRRHSNRSTWNRITHPVRRSD